MIPQYSINRSSTPDTGAIRKRSLQEILDETKDQVRYLHRDWEEVKVRAACYGRKFSTVDDEMTHIEHGRVHIWDEAPDGFVARFGHLGTWPERVGRQRGK